MNHPIIHPDRISVMVASNAYWQFYKEQLGHPEWPDKLRYRWSNRYSKTLGVATGSYSYQPTLCYITYSGRALNFPSILNELVAHEVAHIAANCHHKIMCGHDQRWQNIMAMTGITPRITLENGNFGRYLECWCETCFNKHYITRRHAKNGRFICNHCNAPLDNSKFVEPREVIGV